MCPFECEALQQLRLYRAQKAERAVQAARRAQRAVESEIEQARIAVEQARHRAERPCWMNTRGRYCHPVPLCAGTKQSAR